MLISRQRHTQILQATVFVAALLLCFLPSLEEITFGQDLSPVALSSDMFADGEERDSGDPLHHSFLSHTDALFQQLVSSLQRVTPTSPSRENTAAGSFPRHTVSPHPEASTFCTITPPADG